jgi:hypothetical protein
MDKVTLGFLFLIVILFASSLFFTESFVDASGTNVDASGSKITLSLADLFSLLGSGTSTTTTPTTTPIISRSSTSNYGTPESTFDQQFYSNLKGTILSDVRQTVRDTLQSQGGAAANAGPVLTDSCIDSAAAQQGADFMRYIPGKNPADYIRKDSIPCYGCSL